MTEKEEGKKWVENEDGGADRGKDMWNLKKKKKEEEGKLRLQNTRKEKLRRGKKTQGAGREKKM